MWRPGSFRIEPARHGLRAPDHVTVRRHDRVTARQERITARQDRVTASQDLVTARPGHGPPGTDQVGHGRARPGEARGALRTCTRRETGGRDRATRAPPRGPPG